MAFKPKRACAYRGCGNLTNGKYCYEHSHLNKKLEREKEEHRESAHKRGYNNNWRKLRQIILSRNPMCQFPGCTLPATDIDHIVALRDGGDNSDSNLQALCHRHHSIKTAKENHGFGR